MLKPGDVDPDTILIIDADTDGTDTADAVVVRRPALQSEGVWAWSEGQTLHGESVARGFYDCASAQSYGEGSYTISRADFEAVLQDLTI